MEMKGLVTSARFDFEAFFIGFDLCLLTARRGLLWIGSVLIDTLFTPLVRDGVRGALVSFLERFGVFGSTGIAMQRRIELRKARGRGHFVTFNLRRVIT